MKTDTGQGYLFQDLKRLYKPRSIAIVGASDREHSIGNHALRNVTEFSDFKGKIYPVNPKKEEIAGLKCFPDMRSLPEAPDVMIVVIPAAGVVEAVEQAGEKGVPFAVILTSGFSEADEWGKQAEAELVAISRRTGIRLYGPNCPGLVNINDRLGMTFSPAFKNDLRPGPIGLATQGGGLGRNMLQNMDRGAGFAVWSSSGNESDLQVADFIYYMADAPDVKVIGILIEGIKDGPRFAAAALHAAKCGKPIVGLKVGRSEYGQKAAQSHTASITGSAEVNSAVFAQLGIIEVDDIDELIDVAHLLSLKLPEGDEKLAVFASSGGAASLCADTVGSAGLTLATFTEGTARRLAEALPRYANMSNPIDTTSISISHPQAYADALAAVADDPNVGLVVCPMPMDYGPYTGKTAGIVVETAAETSVPVCPVWMSERPGEGYKAFADAGVMPFRSLRNMGKAVRRWADWGKWCNARDPAWRPLIVSSLSTEPDAPIRTLTEVEGKRALAAAGIETTTPEIAASAKDAARIAQGIGGRLAMKVVSPDIIHKSDVGGVRLAVTPAEVGRVFGEIVGAVKKAAPQAAIEGVLLERMAPEGGIEAFVGVSRDPVFGYMMTFGLGGLYVEMFQDVARRMLPVTAEMVPSMVAELASARLLSGYRGQPPSDLDALANMIASISDFVTGSHGAIDELEINPIWVGRKGEGVQALDAVVRVKT